MNSISRLSTFAAAAIALAACATPSLETAQRPSDPTPVVTVHYEPAAWSEVPGWHTDELIDAWRAFITSCEAIGSRADWQSVCDAAEQTNASTSEEVRAFFEQQLRPYGIVRTVGSVPESSGLITGYYEPLLFGSRSQSPRFTTPLYARPPDLLSIDLASVHPELAGKRVRGRLEGNRVVPYFSRQEIQQASTVQGSEIVWVDSPIDASLIQIQGSGRVQLPSGETIRLQYADQNGHPYRAIGRYLVDIGEMPLEQVTISTIRQWLGNHPDRLDEVLNSNPSVVFFREERLEDPSRGPKGSLGVALTAGRSIAVDRRFVPLGAPVFLATTDPLSTLPLRRLVLAQDTGGAIRGAIRADLFWGFGSDAAAPAGEMRHPGQMWLVWPKTAALPSLAEATSSVTP